MAAVERAACQTVGLARRERRRGRSREGGEEEGDDERVEKPFVRAAAAAAPAKTIKIEGKRFQGRDRAR